MTKQESFKRRVRARMEKTGEKYGAARRSLIERSSATGRTWAAEPESSDDSVRAATGRGWDEWCDLIDASLGEAAGHGDIVGFLQEEHGVDGWWSQSIAVGYERITGLRLPHQQPDGTFTANKSKTVHLDADLLRKSLLHDEDRADLFPGIDTELRSRPDAKALRVTMSEGVALFAIEPVDDGRVKVTVQHSRLPAFDDVAQWKAYWGDWLEAIDEG